MRWWRAAAAAPCPPRTQGTPTPPAGEEVKRQVAGRSPQPIRGSLLCGATCSGVRQSWACPHPHHRAMPQLCRAAPAGTACAPLPSASGSASTGPPRVRRPAGGCSSPGGSPPGSGRTPAWAGPPCRSCRTPRRHTPHPPPRCTARQAGPAQGQRSLCWQGCGDRTGEAGRGTLRQAAGHQGGGGGHASPVSAKQPPRAPLTPRGSTHLRSWPTRLSTVTTYTVSPGWYISPQCFTCKGGVKGEGGKGGDEGRGAPWPPSRGAS